MKWLLKFVPYLTIIDYLCDLAKKLWTSKTHTVLDDMAVDKILRPSLIMWWQCVTDPNINAEGTALNMAELGINFLDNHALEELEQKILDRRKELDRTYEPNK